ncbi:MAG TPA: ACT domain-containing protein [Acidimicrobiales bacterium]|nr:ACT domain-containing protein [Acidimicrobiales bacterium]
MPRFSIHAIGTNRPGIVFGVTEAIAAHGWDIGDAEMTILETQFAISLVIDSGVISDGRVIEEALSPVTEEMNLFFAVLPINGDPTPVVGGATLAAKVVGPNRPGIIAQLARVFTDVEADIRHLDSRLVSDGTQTLSVTELSATIPSTVDPSTVQATLEEIARKLGAECSVLERAGGIAAAYLAGE